MKRISGGCVLAVAATFVVATTLVVPAGATEGQRLTGVRSVTGAEGSSCAHLTSDQVDCWGFGSNGDLGDGSYYSGIPHHGSAVPVAAIR
jgi:hypothetical protein